MTGSRSATALTPEAAALIEHARGEVAAVVDLMTGRCAAAEVAQLQALLSKCRDSLLAG